MSSLKIQLVNKKIRICKLKMKIEKLKQQIHFQEIDNLLENETSEENTQDNDYSKIDLTKELISLNCEALNMPCIIKCKAEITEENLLLYQCLFIINDFQFYLTFKTENTQNNLYLNPFEPLNTITEASFQCDDLMMQQELKELQKDLSERKNIPVLIRALKEYTEKYKMRKYILDKITNDDDFQILAEDNGFLIKIMKSQLLNIHWSFEWNSFSQNIDSLYKIKINSEDFARQYEEQLCQMCSVPEMSAKEIKNIWEHLIEAIKDYES